MQCGDGDVSFLEAEAIIAFDGNIRSGLLVHPDLVHVVYTIGNKVSIQNWHTKEQHFLSGHTNLVCSLDLSRSGKYIASGQLNHMGFKACFIIWDFYERTIITKQELHKVRVEICRFTRDECFLITIGGRDDSTINIWDIAGRSTIYNGAVANITAGDCYGCSAVNRRGRCFITCGDGTLRLWAIYPEKYDAKFVEVNCGKLKRVYTCIVGNSRDEYGYCGTTSGDIVKIRFNYHYDTEILDCPKVPVIIGCYGLYTGKKTKGQDVDRYSRGVQALLLLADGSLLIGAGDGTIDLVVERDIPEEKPITGKLTRPTTPNFKKIKRTNVFAMVTSMVLFNENVLLVATDHSEIYTINLDTFDLKLKLTCHTAAIFACVFPWKYSGVFATASKGDVRIWSMDKKQELLRIKHENFYCSSLTFTYSGKAIITGWNDGIVRAFTPLTGRLMWSITNAHNKGISCLAITSDDKRLITGGCEGQVRVWALHPSHQTMEIIFKEHAGPVTSLHINCFDSEAASSSTDGTVIIWDLIRMVRKIVLFANTLFTCVRYYPTAVQLLTGSADKRVVYWEALDGSLIRELRASASGAINTVSISMGGELFATGSNDQIVKLWDYMDGTCSFIGCGHSASITAVAISPDSRCIVSCSASGSIFIWKIPEVLLKNIKHSAEYVANDAEAEKKCARPLKNQNMKNKALAAARSNTTIGKAKVEEDIRNKAGRPTESPHVEIGGCPCVEKTKTDKAK